MTKPNVGDSVKLKSGQNGQVWGTLESADGVFVQLAPNGEFVAYDAVEEPAPADEKTADQPEGEVIADQGKKASGKI